MTRFLKWSAELLAIGIDNHQAYHSLRNHHRSDPVIASRLIVNRYEVYAVVDLWPKYQSECAPNPHAITPRHAITRDLFPRQKEV